MVKNRAMEQDRLISVLMYRQPGVLDKLTSLLRRRGFQTEGISAGRTKGDGLLRMTVHLRGDDRCLEQVQKQLGKIVETVKVTAINPHRQVRREMALVQIDCREGERTRLIGLATEFKGRIADSDGGGLIVELTDEPQVIDEFISRIDAAAVVDVARSGIVAMNGSNRKNVD
jgi:acetolactate synthase I/III small subunit